ncbi:MAG: tRNA pseudouridine(55) synthase TruB [Candidatus Paceibacterota bacterium]|jgi:tRNA pseudouridine55 synthase
MKGLFLFNKPVGISSAGFLNKLKSYFASSFVKTLADKKASQDQSSKRLKIGHGGTLDPFAEGLLVVGVGREYTKQLHGILKNKTKTYKAEIILGASSDTYDITGKIFDAPFIKTPIEKEIILAVEKIKSKKTQIPPIFSAIKIKGVPAYKLAREGKEVRVESKEALLINYEIFSIKKSEDKIILDIELEVSAGFYIRSFAHDLGVELGSDGYVSKLIRSKIGDFDIKDALTLQAIGLE